VGVVYKLFYGQGLPHVYIYRRGGMCRGAVPANSSFSSPQKNFFWASYPQPKLLLLLLLAAKDEGKYVTMVG